MAEQLNQNSEQIDRPRHERSVVVTGGTRRLGRVLSEALAADGWDIVATHSGGSHSTTATVDDFRLEIETRFGVACRCVAADLVDPGPDKIAAIFDACPSPLYGLVNNAGLFKWDNLVTLERGEIEEMLAVNLISPMLATAEFSRRIGQGAGIVVFMLDQKILNPYPDHLTYTVSKGALHMLMTMCAREGGRAARFYGLAPGLTIPAPGQSVANFEAAQKTVPLGISPTPAELERAIQFLFRGFAANGSLLVVDGGASLVTRERDFEFHRHSGP